MKKFILLSALIFLFAPQLCANNVTLANISLTDQNITGHYCNIKFDITWENSWRTSTSVPGNWDASWVFAKYRVNGGPWHHCTLSSTAGNHIPPSGSTFTPTTDGKGVFIYRSADGYGSNTWTNAKLRWNYGTDGISDDALVEVRLFAIEMVYIPEGAFYIGDGNGTSESAYALHQGAAPTSVQINTSLVQNIRVSNASTYDDGQIKNPGIGIKGDGGLDTDNNGTIDNNEFPTGYRAFYIMKYEISQEQYAEFLNTLTRTQQMVHVASDISGTSVTNYFVMENNNFPQFYNSIRCNATIPAQPNPVTFYCDYNNNGIQEECDGLCLPCNYLNWIDCAAYADWAGLRPMSELEYEKATRGPNTSVYGEFAWGNTNIATNASQIDVTCFFSGITLTPSTNTGAANYNYTSGFNGEYIVRCGIFADQVAGHTRQTAGAGYYGVLEMSGNVWEPVVNIGTVAGRSYRAIDGNGELNPAGYADANYWPGINGNSEPWTANGIYGGTTGVTQSAGSGFKGGNKMTLPEYLCISNRMITGSPYNIVRQDTDGGRFVRNAP
jgi:formylglycine-generating enzyme required for sulfatase activity